MEHVAQSNQYFLVTVGISLRNKPSLINHMENHSQTLTDTSENASLWGEGGKFVWCQGNRVSLYLLMWACMFDDFDNWAFVWDLPPPSCCLLRSTPPPPSPPSPSLLSSLVLLLLWYFSLLHPRSNLACEIAPFSSTPPLGVLLFDFLSGWLQSLLPCPWSATLAANTLSDPSSWRWPHIYHHGDNLCTAVCHTHPKDSAE